jgi:hypothetical protein
MKKSKESIRSQILSYTNQIWGTKKIERLDPLVQMMVGTLANELYLIQNKLGDIDTVLLERIAREITPEKCVSVRPAHTVLQMVPKEPTITLPRSCEFGLEWSLVGSSQDLDTISFYPITDFKLHNAKIDSLFYHKQLYTFDESGKKQVQMNTDTQLKNTSVWIGLDMDSQIKNLNGLSFYLDFPQLSEIHELYQILPYTKCFINGKEVRLKQGLPTHKQHLTETDSDIFRYYNDHYLTIDEDVDVNAWEAQSVPEVVKGMMDEKEADSLPPKHWLCLEFPSYFTADILQDMDMAINAFPVVNRRLIETVIPKNNLLKTTTLTSELGEKLLSVESVTDDKKRTLLPDTITGNNEVGTYHIETIYDAFIEKFSLTDYVEQLLDLVDDERAVFSDINRDKIEQVLFELTENDGTGTNKSDSNNRSREDEISCLSLNPHEKTNAVDLRYWLTYGERINDIPSEKIFTPDKTSTFDGLFATSLCEIHGAKEFTDIQDIMSINKFIFTSKDRIISEHNIKYFCESELGRAIEKAEVELGGKISPKPKEGLVRVLNINLTPSKGNSDLLYRKGVLKSLKMRMENRSPEDYLYEIRIVG